VQAEPIKPTLKAPGIKRIELKYDKSLSKFAFKFHLRHYIKVLVNRIPSLPPRLRALAMRDGLREAIDRQAEVRAGGTEAAADAWRLAALAADAGGAEQTARAGELLAGRERLTSLAPHIVHRSDPRFLRQVISVTWRA